MGYVDSLKSSKMSETFRLKEKQKLKNQYSEMPKSEHVRISDRGSLFGTKYSSNAKNVWNRNKFVQISDRNFCLKSEQKVFERSDFGHFMYIKKIMTIFLVKWSRLN